MKKRGNKKGQEIFGVSFGMLFAIILVIFFIIIGGIAIKAFLDFQRCAKMGIFTKELNDRVNEAWNSEDATFNFEGDLPSEIEYVCFANLSEAFNGISKMRGIWEEINRYSEEDNLFFYPPRKACDMPSNKILHINMERITESDNPFCIMVNKGKVIMMLEKENNEKTVRISR